MPTTTLLSPPPLLLPSLSLRYLCPCWWTCHSTGRHTWRVRCDSLLATGQLLSVIPPTIRQNLDVAIKPARGWRGQIPTWFGIPCRIGRVAVWLPIEQGPELYREFSLLVTFPDQNLETR